MGNSPNHDCAPELTEQAMGALFIEEVKKSIATLD